MRPRIVKFKEMEHRIGSNGGLGGGGGEGNCLIGTEFPYRMMKILEVVVMLA